MLCFYIFQLFSLVLTFGAIVSGAPVDAGKDPIARDDVNLISYRTSAKTSGMLSRRAHDLQPMSRTLGGADHALIPYKAVRLFKKVESRLRSLTKAPRGQIDDSHVWDDMVQALKDASIKLVERIREELEKGREVGDRTINRLQEAREKLKDLGFVITERLRDAYENAPEKARERFRQFLEKLGIEAK